MAGLTAVDVVVLLLCIGFVAACFGAVGGAGVRLRDRMHVRALEATVDALGGLVNRYKGAAGQAVLQQQKLRLTKRDEEAQELARKLSRSPIQKNRSPLSEDEADEFAATQLEQEAKRRGFVPKDAS